MFTDINKCKIKNYKRVQETDLIDRSPLRRRRWALDCSANYEEEEGEEEGEEGEEEGGRGAGGNTCR
jgi:hypothetical protein